MKTSVILTLIALLVSSCVTNKSQDEMDSFSFNLGNHQEISHACEEIMQTGDIYTLLWEIKQDTREVLRILDGKPFNGMEEVIEGIAQEIRMSSEKVLELTKPEWNAPNVRQVIRWELTEKDFGLKDPYLFDPQIKAVYFLGKETPELLSRMKVIQLGNSFTIEYLNKATLLEYCQLNETLMIVLEVKINRFFGPKSKLFNLHVNLGK